MIRGISNGRGRFGNGRLAAVWVALAALAAAAPVPMVLRSADGREAKVTKIDVDGARRTAWMVEGGGGAWKFETKKPLSSDAPSPLYLQIDYLDRGYGRLVARLSGGGNDGVEPDRHLGLTLTDSGRMVSARMRFPGVSGRAGKPVSLRLRLHESKEPLLAVESVTLETEPFDDPAFRFVITDPWEGPYTGRSIIPADNRTLKGKLMTGYQGWFRTPNDPYGGGWRHWGNIPDGEFHIDMWPEISQYPPEFLAKAGDVKTKSGRQGYLFSSAWPAVVDKHFEWMRESDIDGAFLQRFVGDYFHSVSGKPEWVLSNVRAAAHRHGRLWAIEYDVSGYPDEKLLETLKTDWKWFVDEFGIRGDSNYAREGGKPVVFIWGLPFPNRNFTPETANAVLDFFKNDPDYGGNHVIGGIPGNWREMDRPWQDHITGYNCVLAWMSKEYARDRADLRTLGLAYYGHAMPGFSWANLKHLPTGDETLAYTPRDGGEFYWNQITAAAEAGVDRLFLGMFDEYDEATAIMPMSDDPPPTPVKPGVAATFYQGERAGEHGRFIRLPAVDVDLAAPPQGSRVEADHFYVRLGGRITFPTAGAYRFSIEGAAGDDVEMFVNGRRVLNARGFPGSVEVGEEFKFPAGGHLSYRIDYRHRSGGGRMRLFWQAPGRPRQPVPAPVLHDAWGRFIGNEGKPADWWLELSRRGKRLISESAGSN